MEKVYRYTPSVNQTGSVKERQRTGKPLKTTPREDRPLKRLARQQPFSTANMLRSRWIVNWHISRWIVNRHLNNARFRARIPIKCLLLPIRHKTSRLQWARYHMGWNIRSWQRMHWSDESRFFVESSWWLRPRIETEKHSISTGTYCGHNCIWWRWCYCLVMLFSKL